MSSSFKISSLVLSLACSVVASPYPRFSKRDFKVIIDTDQILEPSLAGSFADPGLVQAGDGKWYAFATESNGAHVPVAVADEPLGDWTRLEQDAMPDIGWTSGIDFWAPDVRRLSDGSYIMYFSGRYPGDRHCIGISRSSEVTGPYEPDPGPFVCELDRGGNIDPAGFLDEQTGKRYVTYKIDGNAVGNGGSCGNTVEPIVDTPLMLQEVDVGDGSTSIGDPVAILHLEPETEGPVIEAPNIVYIEGVYVLFYSSGCYDGDGYKTRYAYASSVSGPYTRAPETLLETPDLGLVGPGGATSTEDGTLILALHGYCGDKRCMYVVEYEVEH